MGNPITFSQFENTLQEEREKLLSHPIPSFLESSDFLKSFMEVHVFAVWDFMSLLKFLQRTITSIDVPWRPSTYSPKLVRFINEIVLGEESDKLDDGQVMDHFSLYIKAMEEIGADTETILKFSSSLDFRPLPREIQKFLSFHLGLVTEGRPHKVAASFFFGREEIIPRMFSPMVEVLEKEKIPAPLFHTYLQRHIELDGDHHGPLAKELLTFLCQDRNDLWNEALEVGIQSLQARRILWDYIIQESLETRQKQVVEVLA